MVTHGVPADVTYSAVTYQAVAYRVTRDALLSYDWHVHSGKAGAPPVILAHEDRHRWPHQIRAFGVDDLQEVAFHYPADRFLFAADCRL